MTLSERRHRERPDPHAGRKSPSRQGSVRGAEAHARYCGVEQLADAARRRTADPPHRVDRGQSARRRHRPGRTSGVAGRPIDPDRRSCRIRRCRRMAAAPVPGARGLSACGPKRLRRAWSQIGAAFRRLRCAPRPAAAGADGDQAGRAARRPGRSASAHRGAPAPGQIGAGCRSGATRRAAPARRLKRSPFDLLFRSQN